MPDLLCSYRRLHQHSSVLLNSSNSSVAVCSASMLSCVQGTNGGVTLAGLGASMAGGLFMGVVFFLGVLAAPAVAGDSALREAALQQWLLVPAGDAFPGCAALTALCRSRPRSALPSAALLL